MVLLKHDEEADITHDAQKEKKKTSNGILLG